jgi:hypothetical protein
MKIAVFEHRGIGGSHYAIVRSQFDREGKVGAMRVIEVPDGEGERLLQAQATAIRFQLDCQELFYREGETKT